MLAGIFVLFIATNYWLDRYSLLAKAGSADGWLRALPEVQVDFLHSIGPVEVPTLWYLHLLLPHQP